jgi:hypothetical protein
MHIYEWTMKPTGGAITIDGKNELGEDVKVRHVKAIRPIKVITTHPRRWYQKKARRTVESVFLRATDADGLTHILHIIG